MDRSELMDRVQDLTFHHNIFIDDIIECVETLLHGLAENAEESRDQYDANVYWAAAHAVAGANVILKNLGRSTDLSDRLVALEDSLSRIESKLGDDSIELST